LYAGDSKGILGMWHRERGAWMLKHKMDVMNVRVWKGVIRFYMMLDSGWNILRA
jgi:hypothetical protein